MAYNFKKIKELELINEVPEGTNVLIETDGATKRLPSTAINNGYSKEESDEKFVAKDAIAQPNLAQNDPTAPDYVKNRTHYESEEIVNEPLNITWDGNTEGLVTVRFDYEEGYILFVKVSDAILTDEQIKSAKVTVEDTFQNTSGEYVTSTHDIILEVVWNDAISNGFVTEEIVSVDNTVFVREPTTFMGVHFPESGIYFSYTYFAGPPYDETIISALTTTEPIEQTKTVVHKLDKKFIEKTMLYVDDGHLYHDAAFTRKVSAAELNSMMDYGVMLKVNHYVYFPLMYEYDAKYGSLLSYMTEDGLAGAITKEADNES
jgi:uncharacterized protein YrrD